MIAASNVLEQGRNLITPSMAARIALALGSDQQLISRGTEVALSLLTLALAQSAATADGADSVRQLVSTADATVLTDLAGYVERYRPADGEATLKAVLGPGQSLVFASLRRAAGSDLRPLTALLAPVLLALLGAIAWSRHADAASLARLLLREAERALDSGSPAVRIVNAALVAGAAQPLPAMPEG